MAESKNSRMLRVRNEVIDHLDAVAERWWLAEGAGQMSRDWENDTISYSEIIERLLAHYEKTRERRKRAAVAKTGRRRKAAAEAVVVPRAYVQGNDGRFFANPMHPTYKGGKVNCE